MEEKLGWQSFHAELVLLVKLNILGVSMENFWFIANVMRHMPYTSRMSLPRCFYLLCLLLSFPEQCLENQDVLAAKQAEGSVTLIASKH